MTSNIFNCFIEPEKVLHHNTHATVKLKNVSSIINIRKRKIIHTTWFIHYILLHHIAFSYKHWFMTFCIRRQMDNYFMQQLPHILYIHTQSTL